MNKIILVILSCISVTNSYCAAEDHLRALKERIGNLALGYRCEEGAVYESVATAMDAHDFKTDPDSMPTCELFILFGHDTQAERII